MLRFLLIGFLLTVSAQADPVPDDAQAPYAALSGEELVQQLQKKDNRERAFYELWRRAKAGYDEGFEEFAQFHGILDVVACPQPDGGPPVFVAVYDFPVWSYTFGYGGYIIDSPEKLFPSAAAEVVVGPDTPKLHFFSAEGKMIAPYGRHDELDGPLADLNGDGLIERVRTKKYYDGNLPDGQVLEVSAVAPEPRPLLSVLMDWGTEEWTYRLRDIDGDGVYEIELGPRVGIALKPKAVYRWDAASRAYKGPAGAAGDHFRRLEPGNTQAQLLALASAGLTFPKDPHTLKPGAPRLLYAAPSPPPAKAYVKRPLADLPDSEVLGRMGRGRAGWDFAEQHALKNTLPAGFWKIPPDQAVLALLEANRSKEHKATCQIALDDRDGAAPPAAGSVATTVSPPGCGVSLYESFFLRADPEGSYLVLAGVWAGNLNRYNYFFDQPAFDLRICRLPYAQARQIFATIWWLDRVRSRGLNPTSFPDDNSTPIPIVVRDAEGRTLADREANRWYSPLAQSWTANYDHIAFVSFATWLLVNELPAKIGSAWREAEQEARLGASLGQDHLPHYSEADRKRLSVSALRFLNLFSPSQDRISFAATAVAADAAGTLVLPEAIPLLKNILAAIPPTPPPERDYDKIREEEEKVRSSSAPAARAARERRLAELDAERKEVFAYDDWEGPANLRRQAELALRKIETDNDPARLLAWARSKEPGAQWAFQRLRDLDPPRYIEALEWQLGSQDAELAAQILEELRRIAPDQVDAILSRTPPEKRVALTGPDSPRLREAAALPDDTARVAAWLAIVKDPASSVPDVEAAIAKLVPRDAPLRFPDKAIDDALLAIVEKKQKAPLNLRSTCFALARRGNIAAFDAMRDTLFAIADILYYDRTIGPLALLAQADPAQLNPKLHALLAPEFDKTAKDVNAIFWAIWSADLREFQRQLERHATSCPNDYEDERGSGGKPTPVAGRFHLARKFADLWNAKDPVTTIRLLTALALGEPYIFSSEPNPAAEAQLFRQLRLAGKELTPAQRERLEKFFALAEKPSREGDSEESESRKRLVAKVREMIETE